MRFVSILLVVILACLSISPALADPGDDACGDDQTNAPNVVSANCRFEGGGHEAPGFNGLVRNGWNPFVLSGSPTFDTNDTHNGYNWLPARQGDQKIYTFGKPWSAGVWQLVNNVVPGRGYRAEAGWVVSQNTLAEGRIGIDPTGGTDPASPNIIWSRPIKVCNAMRCRHIVQAYAANTTISVWMWVNLQRPIGSDNCWITAVAVKTDPTMPTATPAPTNTPTPTATNTRIPPTRTPTRLPATNTPLPTDTPATTPTAINTATATPSPTETVMPSPTATRRPTATPTAQSLLSLTSGANSFVMDTVAMGLLGATGCALVAAIGLSGFAFWFWRRR